MHERARIWIAACFYYSGLVKLVRWWTQRSGSCLIILNYHRASGGDLRSHLLYLRHHYRILHLETALEELYKPHRQKRDRHTLLALTFDDGYRDNYTHALALACELQIPITIFLIPAYIESGNCFWWLEGDRLIRHAQVEEVKIEGRTYRLAQKEERKALVQAIYTRACNARSVAEREAFFMMVREALAISATVPAEEEAVLKWEEIHEMKESGWVSFGAHTMHHPVLAYLADSSELSFEIEECRAILEQQLGHPVCSFAYPLGKSEHIGDTVLHAVRQAGYDWAVTTLPGRNTRLCDPYLLRRNNAGANQHWLVVAADTAGVWGFFSRLYGIARLPIRKYLTKGRILRI
jgi:peptidoglycan/xylan/chitin deacetylase (PgdA/CDA1 family)